MRQVLAIASREFVERKLVIAAGGVLAVMTLFTPFLPGVEGFTKGDIIGIASGWVSMMILFVGALVMGMTSINGDLSERRLGFYFARPVSGLAIWLGKVTGTLAVVIVTAAIAFLPAGVDGFSSILEIEAFGVFVFAWTLVGFFFFGHVTACFARVRSIWILLDFAGLFVLVAGVVTLFKVYVRTVSIDYLGPFILDAAGLSIQILIGLAVIASATGVILGRVDPTRVHRWTSTALWTLVASGLLVAWIAATWIAAATPRDVRAGTRTVEPVGREGEWIGVSGFARAGLYQEFVMNPAGRHLALGSKFGLVASASRFVAIEPDPGFRFRRAANMIFDGTIVYADLDGDLEWQRTKIDVEGMGPWGVQPALSKEGTRLAIPTESGLAVYSLPDETMLRAVAFDLSDTSWYARMFFVDDDRLRILKTSKRTSSLDDAGRSVSLTEVFDVTISSGRQISRASFEATSFVVDPSGQVVVVKTGNERRVIDLETGLTTGTFESKAHWGLVRWLADGRLAISEDVGPGAGRSLRVVTREGEEIARLDFPDAEMLRLGYEPRPGVLMATAGPMTSLDSCRERRLLEIDLKAGTSREVGRGLTTLFGWTSEVPQGSTAARTFATCDGRVVRFDQSLAGSKTVLD